MLTYGQGSHYTDHARWQKQPLPVATLGGHKARGNPLGAAGVYQAVEACLQLRGEAGTAQVPQAHVGMIQSLAGTGSTAVTHILMRVEG